MGQELRDNRFLGNLDIDLSAIVEQDFKKLSYISWSNAYTLLMGQDPTASFRILTDSEGMPFFSRGDVHFVMTEVTAFGETKSMFLPVMDNNHNAVKYQPYEIKTTKGAMHVPALDGRQVNDSIMRCLVKNIALFGIGLSLYIKNKDGLEAILNMDEAAPIQQIVQTQSAPAPVTAKPAVVEVKPEPAPEVKPEPKNDAPKGNKGKGGATTKAQDKKPVEVKPEPVVEDAPDEPEVGEALVGEMKSVVQDTAIKKGITKKQIENRNKTKTGKTLDFADFEDSMLIETYNALLLMPDADTVKQEASKVSF